MPQDERQKAAWDGAEEKAGPDAPPAVRSLADNVRAFCGKDPVAGAHSIAALTAQGPQFLAELLPLSPFAGDADAQGQIHYSKAPLRSVHPLAPPALLRPARGERECAREKSRCGDRRPYPPGAGPSACSVRRVSVASRVR
jgi:hypothetical protein